MAIDIIPLPQTAFSAVTKQEAPRNAEQGIKQDKVDSEKDAWMFWWPHYIHL